MKMMGMRSGWNLGMIDEIIRFLERIRLLKCRGPRLLIAQMFFSERVVVCLSQLAFMAEFVKCNCRPFWFVSFVDFV